MNVWWLATSAKDGDSCYFELKQRKVLAQGWPEIGDLTDFIRLHTNQSSLERKLHNLIEEIYPNKNKQSDKHREKSIVNLLRIKPEDIIVICEGINVKGLAKVTEPLIYSFNNNYEYAQQVGPVKEWKDWDSIKVGKAPKTPGQGPKGVEHCRKDAQHFINAWNIL